MTFLSFSKASHSKVCENSGCWYYNELAVQMANCMNTTHTSRSCSTGGKVRVRDTSCYSALCWRVKLLLQCLLVFSKWEVVNTLWKKLFSIYLLENKKMLFKTKIYFIYNLSQTKLIFRTLGWTIIGYRGFCNKTPHDKLKITARKNKSQSSWRIS